MDQLSEMYLSTSPYAYVANNPITFLDPDGRCLSNLAGEFEDPNCAADIEEVIIVKPKSNAIAADPFPTGDYLGWNWGLGGSSGTSGSGAAGSSGSSGGGLGGGFNVGSGYRTPEISISNRPTFRPKYSHDGYKYLEDLANSRFFSIGNLIASESISRFASYSLAKALKPDYSVNFTVLDVNANPSRMTTVSGIKMQPTAAATVGKIAQGTGFILAGASVAATELQYRSGTIGETERWANHLMTGVGTIPTPWTMGIALGYGVVTGGYQAITGRSIFNDADAYFNQHGYYIP